MPRKKRKSNFAGIKKTINKLIENKKEQGIQSQLEKKDQEKMFKQTLDQQENETTRNRRIKIDPRKSRKTETNLKRRTTLTRRISVNYKVIYQTQIM